MFHNSVPSSNHSYRRHFPKRFWDRGDNAKVTEAVEIQKYTSVERINISNEHKSCVEWAENIAIFRALCIVWDLMRRVSGCLCPKSHIGEFPITAHIYLYLMISHYSTGSSYCQSITSHMQVEGTVLFVTLVTACTIVRYYWVMRTRTAVTWHNIAAYQLQLCGVCCLYCI